MLTIGVVYALATLGADLLLTYTGTPARRPARGCAGLPEAGIRRDGLPQSGTTYRAAR